MLNIDTRLVEITLSGFQAFRKPSVVPISPITLIYGPNSAGKSAIYDALSLLRQFFSSTSANGTSGKNWPFVDQPAR